MRERLAVLLTGGDELAEQHPASRTGGLGAAPQKIVVASASFQSCTIELSR